MLVSLVHGDGVVFLNASDAPYAVVGKDLSVPGSFFTRHKETGLEATTFTGNLVAIGEQRMLAHRNVRPERLKMDKPLVVATSRRLDAILAPWRREAALSAGAWLLAALASAWALHAYQRRHRQFLRKEAEAAQALHDSERLMKMVTDNVPGMIAYWNDRLCCEFSNAAYLEWFGRTSQQMRGIRMQDLMGPELFAKNEPHIRAALRGEPQEFERTLTKADGSTGYTYAHYVPDLRDGTVKGFFVLVSDVTRVKLAEVALAESEARLKAIIETAPECVTLIALDGTLLRINRAGLAMIEADSEAQVLGTDATALAAPEHRAAFAGLHEKLIRGESGELEFEIVGLKGTRRWAAMQAVPMRDALGRITGALGITHDISERRKVAQELERLANTDSLTGLDNRRQFVNRVEHEIARTLRYGGRLSVLMLDVDHFKRVNDTYGHRTGDLVLQNLAGICARSLRDIDIIGRMGGEEFAIALPQTGAGEAREVAERVRQAIAQADIETEQGTILKITASIGIAAMGSVPGTVDTLLGEADKALYLAKELGRNRVCAYAGDG
jgi:diguanylate cyclase (GGDEF)-like protein/PAS domain S-box-containing protein